MVLPICKTVFLALFVASNSIFVNNNNGIKSKKPNSAANLN